MVEISKIFREPLPKPLVWCGTPIAALALILLFTYLRFPFDQFGPAISSQLGQMTRSEVRIADIEPVMTWAGPGMVASGVDFIQSGGPPIAIDRLMIRPAWSTRWLRSGPTLKLEIESPLGSAGGLLTLGDAPTWVGQIEVADLAVLPRAAGSSIGLTGSLSANADLRLLDGRAAGPVQFEATSGSFSHPEIPIPVEFERLQGELIFGGQALVELKELQLDGPIIAADIGGVILAPSPGREPRLDIEVLMEVKSAPLKAMMRGMGLRLDRSGRTAFKLGGTPSRPVTR